MKRLRRYFAAVLAALGMLASVSAAAVYRGVVEIGLQPIRKVAPDIRVKADLHRGIIRGEGIYRLPGHIIPAYARQIAAGSARCGTRARGRSSTQTGKSTRWRSLLRPIRG